MVHALTCCDTHIQLASDGIKREFTQGLFDQANYTFEVINGAQLVQKVKTSLSEYFSSKQKAAQVRACVLVHVLKSSLDYFSQLLLIYHRGCLISSVRSSSLMPDGNNRLMQPQRLRNQYLQKLQQPKDSQLEKMFGLD